MLFRSDDGQFAFLSQGYMAVGTQQAQEEYCYPGSLYEGIELFLDLDALSRQPYPLFQESEVSPEEIMEHLHTHRRLYLAATPPTVQTALDELWQLRDSQELGLIKLLSARLLWEVANKIADSRRSLGLGLSLCRSIVNAHGGKITVSDNTPPVSYTHLLDGYPLYRRPYPRLHRA